MAAQKTSTGRRNSSRNARKHGLLSAAVLVEGESEVEWTSFCSDLRQTLGPLGPIEELLFERVCLAGWRLRRAARLEADLIGFLRDTARMGGYAPNASGEALEYDRANVFEKLSRYETALERSFYRAVRELGQRRKTSSAEALH